ncbi:MAG: glycosyltransferase family 2 protein [Patescibacteria group bacterium]
MNNKSADGLISVIMPLYNAEKFLERSIGSVINQSYKNFELVLINDGSTDNSKAICDKWAISDRRIKVISQEHNGPSTARNNGIRRAMGMFVFFIDADDFINKKALETLVAKYNQYNQPDLVITNFCKFETNGTIVNQKATLALGADPFIGEEKILLKADISAYVRHYLKYPSNHTISYCWGKLFKLSIIKDNNIVINEGMYSLEDTIFVLKYLQHTNNIIFINKALYIYVLYDNYMSASMFIGSVDTMLKDLAMFKAETIQFFNIINRNTPNTANTDITREAGHALTNYFIIFIVRACRNVTKTTRKKTCNYVSDIINAPLFIESMKCYTPLKGNSRILPLLSRLRLVYLTVLYCEHRARKRYGKLKINIC